MVACPRPNAALLAAAEMLDIKEIAHMGGAQAIAALAYGTRSVPQVDKIFGPGNRYVTAAKRIVSADCAVDMLAGPTEVLIVATRGEARYIAADLVAQAEHDPDAVAVFVTTSPKLAAAVRDRVAEQVERTFAVDPARRSLAANGCILVARDTASACVSRTALRPGALSVPGGEVALLRALDAAGSFFVAVERAIRWRLRSGTNHVLPTGGGARSRGGLSTWISYAARACSSFRARACCGWRRWSPRLPMQKASWRTSAPESMAVSRGIAERIYRPNPDYQSAGSVRQ